MLALLALGLVALHLGPLHQGEQVLVYALAFGPLLLLVVAIALSKRRRRGTEAEPRDL